MVALRLHRGGRAGSPFPVVLRFQIDYPRADPAPAFLFNKPDLRVSRDSRACSVGESISDPLDHLAFIRRAFFFRSRTKPNAVLSATVSIVPALKTLFSPNNTLV